jgi:hypothetical protein
MESRFIQKGICILQVPFLLTAFLLKDRGDSYQRETASASATEGLAWEL